MNKKTLSLNEASFYFGNCQLNRQIATVYYEAQEQKMKANCNYSQWKGTDVWYPQLLPMLMPLTTCNNEEKKITAQKHLVKIKSIDCVTKAIKI